MKKNPKTQFGVAEQSSPKKEVTWSSLWLAVFLSFLSIYLVAQESAEPDRDTYLQNLDKEPVAPKPRGSPIVELGNEFQNSISFLNNRFRVDDDVEEVTMVFFREPGSAPIVLVRPDGSKLFIESDDQDDKLRWYETQTYDMISIKEPMPGPWQAVGDILPDSKVMVIADIVLAAEPIPENIYSGEVIKQTAVLKNDGEQIDFSPFRDVVSLSIDFVSSNNPNYENFGLGSRIVARFQDNGEGLDESAADGVFTGQFNLSIPSGEWRPTFSIRTPMYNREQINETVILHPNPILIDIKIDETNEAEHIVSVDTDAEHIRLDSLLLDGNITHPNGVVDRVTLTETSKAVKLIKVQNDSYGIYRIKLTAFATTMDGREVIINVPEQTFLTTEPFEPEPEQDPELSDALDENDSPVEPIAIENSADEWTAAHTISVAIGINLLIMIFGGAGLFLVLNKRKYPDNHIMLRLNIRVQQLLQAFKNRKNNSEEKSEE